jgi:hypothetical protein
LFELTTFFNLKLTKIIIAATTIKTKATLARIMPIMPAALPSDFESSY